MEFELSALHKNNTWCLVPSLSGVNLIGCKWVFKLKYTSWMVQLISIKLIQLQKVLIKLMVWTIFEIFSLVIKVTTIHVVFTLVLTYGWASR